MGEVEGQKRKVQIIKESEISLEDLLEFYRTYDPDLADTLPEMAARCLHGALKQVLESMEFDILDCGERPEKIYKRTSQKMIFIMDALCAIGKIQDYDRNDED